MKNNKLDIDPGLFDYVDTLDSKDADEIKNLDAIKNLFKNSSIFDLSENISKFFLRTEALVLQLAYAYNKILSLSNSRTRILAHQVESTHIIVNALNQRFLIADEVGLGKTVEAGLVIKELIYRFGFKRILIACPASLLCQWQNEMQSKFNETFVILDRKGLKKIERELEEGGNPWNHHEKLICSLDFIKNKDFEEDMSRTKWDIVIFDEAHRLRRDSQKSTIAYNTASIISKKTRSLLLLSATPFRGKLEELYYLIKLLDENLLGHFNSFYSKYCYENCDLSGLKKKLDEVVIRRTKAEVGGFTKRNAKTIKFDLYPDERLLYEETTRYVVEEFNKAMQTENRAIGFVMTVFQKLLDSSSYALLIALTRRRDRIQKMVNNVEGHQGDLNRMYDYFDFDVDEGAEDIDELMDSTLKKTLQDLKEELKILKRLVAIAEKIKINKKGEKLLEIIRRLKKRGDKKFLIFTQFKTTQDYLSQLLSDYKLVIFNGSMDLDQKEQAILDFKNDAEIIIATEAGGEGRNMQFCNVLINYDLPWSPLKIEQRIGRVHRFGQAKDVFIYNFSTSDTVADRVLEVLTHKLKLFEDSIGTPDVLLGQIEDELKINNLIMEMVSGKKSKNDVDSEVDERIDNARKSYEKLSNLTLTNKMDFNYDQYYEITLKERQFSNKRIENFINALQIADSHVCEFIGAKHGKNNLYPIKSNSPDIKFKKYGTFDSQIALENENLEFLAFGHPIVDNMIEYCLKDDFGGQIGLRFIEYSRDFVGILFNFKVTFHSVEKTSELIPIVVLKNNLFYSYEIEEIEKETTEQDLILSNEMIPDNEAIVEIFDDIDFYFESCEEKILSKVNSKITDRALELDLYIDPELEKIKKSYNEQILELEEKLQVQEGQMKWYGKDMKSAITRTKNRILKAEKDRDNLLKKYKDYMGIKYTIEMLNVAIVIGVRGD